MIQESGFHEGSSFLYEVAENIREAFWCVDKKMNKVLYVSPSYEAIWGSSVSKLYSNPDHWIESVHVKDRERIKMKFIDNYFTSGHEEQYRIARPDGSVRWVLDRGFIFRDEREGVIGLGRIVEDITPQVKIQSELEEKTIAFKELMHQVESEKQTVRDEILLTVDNLLTPIIKKLRRKYQSEDHQYLKKLEKNLSDLMSSCGTKMQCIFKQFTPKEIEICEMIKNGLTIKEIANILNASPRTIETHRNNIRKKIGLSHKKINLRVYLRTL